jgi:ribonuclease HI
MQSKRYARLKIYSDGASRGNPGSAAIAVKILDENGFEVKTFSKFLGTRTNNEAEYEALITALTLASPLSEGYVDCFLDSELVVKQLNGEYKVKSPRLEDLWLRVCRLQRHFKQVTFRHVARMDKNIREVDEQANRVLDETLG